MSVRSRVAFASGVAGLVCAALLLTGRLDGSVVVVILFVAAARSATPASLGAARALAQQAWFAPAWAVIVAVGVLRAGSPALSDARGANAVAGLALTHGDVLAVAGSWLALAAGTVAIATRTTLGSQDDTLRGTIRRVDVPAPLWRLEMGAILVQSALLVTLFAGPHVADASDAISWVVGIGALAAIAWFTRGVRLPAPSAVAFGLAITGLAATLVGGSP